MLTTIVIRTSKTFCFAAELKRKKKQQRNKTMQENKQASKQKQIMGFL